MELPQLIEQIERKVHDTGRFDLIDPVIDLIKKRLPTYSRVLGVPEVEVLQRWEKNRNVNVINWYQESVIPEIDDSILIFDTVDDFKKRFPSSKSICPNCGEESIDYHYHDKCGWSAGGLFGTLDKGIQVMILETMPLPNWIFMPVELVKQ